MSLLLFPNIVLFHEDVIDGSSVCSESSPEWSVALDPGTSIHIT